MPSRIRVLTKRILGLDSAPSSGEPVLPDPRHRPTRARLLGMGLCVLLISSAAAWSVAILSETYEGDYSPQDRDSSPWSPKTDFLVATLRNRFEVRVSWRDFVQNSGNGKVVQIPSGAPGQMIRTESDDSGLFWFFSSENWELMVKVLNGCTLNSAYWVFTAASTNVEYDVAVTDTWTGTQRIFSNPLGVAAPAVTDTSAFPDACALVEPPPFLPGGQCVEDGQTLCLGYLGRFRVQVQWRDFAGNTGVGRVPQIPSEGTPDTRLKSFDSVLFWFFDEQNWEMMVKVLDGCGLNDRFWVFSAATTNVEYDAVVLDLQTGQVKVYHNPLGTAAPAVNDTAAFATCNPKMSSGPVVIPNVIRLTVSADVVSGPVRFAFPDSVNEENNTWVWTTCHGFANGIAVLNGEQLSYSPDLGWSGTDAGSCITTNGLVEFEVPIHVTVVRE